MIENGHSWSSIQSYSLSEIGVFFKTIIRREQSQHIEKITRLWMGNNLSKKGLDDILKKENATQTKQTRTKEVQNDWHKLKSVMTGVK